MGHKPCAKPVTVCQLMNRAALTQHLRQAASGAAAGGRSFFNSSWSWPKCPAGPAPCLPDNLESHPLRAARCARAGHMVTPASIVCCKVIHNDALHTRVVAPDRRCK